MSFFSGLLRAVLEGDSQVVSLLSSSSIPTVASPKNIHGVKGPAFFALTRDLERI